jgi:F-type H+-transporting ATPase subunit gamma
MPSLKDLKNRIKSVKSTQKITKAMKMVAAAKLRRAKDRAESARPYAEHMENILCALAGGDDQQSMDIPLLTGTGADHTHLIVVMASDRGLCGAFNSSITRATKRKVAELRHNGKDVKLFCVGKKAYDALRSEFGSIIIGRIAEIGKKQVQYIDAQHISKQIQTHFATGAIDVVHIVYNHFKSAISQIVTFQQIIPLPQKDVRAESRESGNSTPDSSHPTLATSSYEYEPSEAAILADLLPRNIALQIFKALLENAASEQGARMSAMDSATRNAGQMIGKLTLKYNRTRQAAITKELIEIISGAEAL